MKHVSKIAFALALFLAAPQAQAMDSSEPTGKELYSLLSRPYENPKEKKDIDIKSVPTIWTWQDRAVKWPRTIAAKISTRRGYIEFINRNAYPPFMLPPKKSSLFPHLDTDNLVRLNHDAGLDRNAALISIKPDAPFSFKEHVFGKKGSDNSPSTLYGIASEGYLPCKVSLSNDTMIETSQDYFDFTDNSMLEKRITNGRSTLVLHAGLKDQKTFDNLSQEDKKTLRDETISALSQRYKIHLQIKPEYLRSFMQDFTEFMTTDKYGRLIYLAKCPLDYEKTVYQDNVASVVAYLELIPGTKNERNALVKNILQALVNRYKNYIDPKDKDQNIALLNPDGSVKTPRSNHQVKGFLFIAQGDGDTKETVKRALTQEKTLGKAGQNYYNPYTDNMAFFKGEEFDEVIS